MHSMPTEEDEEFDWASMDSAEITALLDGIPGAYESAMRGFEQARAGETVSLDEL
jgi:PHD/YefM family antitoxin component YafN of YafNO toxin-antitoxin module